MNSTKMAKSFNLSIFLLLLLFTVISARPPPERAAANHHPTTLDKRARFKAFIETACKTTRYYDLCVHSLTNFASETQTPEQLARVAIRVSLVRARLAREYISRVARDLKQMKRRDYGAISECLGQINEGVAQITNSVNELGKMSLETETYHLGWHESNIYTWLTAAQTEALTCLEGISGHAREKATIRAKVQNVVEVTSNALAFFNGYVVKRRASRP